MAQALKVKRAFLVYQTGIANVFQVKCMNLASYGRNAVRLMQADFRSCENFARGLSTAGALVRTAHCNMAGDIVDETWSQDLETAPFHTQFHPVG
jgi:hypothetical protein